jgi:hypothetical protein
MTAHDLICDLHRRGVRLELSAGASRVRWAAEDESEVRRRDVEALALLKPDVIDALIERDERAAVMEVEGGLSREDAERAAMEELTAQAAEVSR